MGEMIHPLIIHESKRCWFMSNEIQDQMRKNPRPVLWIKEGLYGIIPSETIQNELQVREGRRKLANSLCPNRGYWDVPLGFRWAETVTIPQETGLAMEKYNGHSLDEGDHQRGNSSTDDPDQGNSQPPDVM